MTSEARDVTRECATLLRLRNGVARRRRRRETLGVVLGPLGFLVLTLLVYGVFGDGYSESTGWIELVVYPWGAFMLGQLCVTQFARDVAEETVSGLEVCGASRPAYLGAFLAEYSVLGVFAAVVAAAVASGLDLFRGADFWSLCGLLCAFAVASVGSAAVCAGLAPYDAVAPDASGASQLFLAWQLAGAAIFFLGVVDVAAGYTDASAASPAWQYVSCLHPVAGLLLGIDSFRGPPNTPRGSDAPYTGVPLSGVVGTLAADACAYACLAYAAWADEAAGRALRTALLRLASATATTAPEEAALLKHEHRVAARVVDATGARQPRPPGLGKASVVVDGLRRVYAAPSGGEAVVAVDGVSLEFYEDECFGLLGRNGAGKSTTIRALVGLDALDGGSATVYGRDVAREMRGIRPLLGYCGQRDAVLDELTVREHLVLAGTLRRAADPELDADAVLERLRLAPFARHAPSRLSGGLRRKCSVALALVGAKTKFVVLDEPSAGMDAAARRELWDLLEDAKRGRTVVLTTHYMDEADVLSDVVGVMDRGAVKCVGTPTFLKRHYGGGYRLECARSAGATPEALAAFDALLADVAAGDARGRGRVAARERSGAEARLAARQIVATLDARGADRFPRLFEALDARLDELQIDSYGVGPSTLEQVFLAVGGRDDDVALRGPTTPGADARLDWGDLDDADEAAQLVALLRKQLTVVRHDALELANAGLPCATTALAFALDAAGLFGDARVARGFGVRGRGRERRNGVRGGGRETPNDRGADRGRVEGSQSTFRITPERRETS